MTTKTIKTILFASLIAALVLPFSAIQYAEAQIGPSEIDPDTGDQGTTIPHEQFSIHYDEQYEKFVISFHFDKPVCQGSYYIDAYNEETKRYSSESGYLTEEYVTTEYTATIPCEGYYEFDADTFFPGTTVIDFNFTVNEWDVENASWKGVLGDVQYRLYPEDREEDVIKYWTAP